MKKLIIALTATVVAASAFAQGTVVFNNRVTGVVVEKVYDVDGTTGLAGTGYTAELWAANGANAVESSLAAATPQTTFRTGAAAGFVTAPPTDAVLTGVPKDAAVATLQLRAWDNKGGTITTWAAAEAAWNLGQIAAGKSALFNLNAIGGDLNTSANLVGLKSFNIYMVPEPSTFALLGLGTLGMLIFRRK